MIDINYSLRIAYNAALTGIAGVPAYYQSLPNDRSDKTYIVFRSINNTDVSTTNSSDTSTTITVEIHTWNDIVNEGLNCDQIAREVFNRIYPDRQTNLSIDGAQIVNTQVANDVTNDFTQAGGRGYISRFITFRHFIFQRSDIS